MMKKVATFIALVIVSAFLISCGDGQPLLPPVTQRQGVSASQYVIVVPEDATKLQRYAAEELKSYLALNGAQVDIVSDSEAEAEVYEICIGQVDRQNAPAAQPDLGEEGFSIKNVEGRVFLSGNTDRAILYGTYSLLESMGYRFYAKNVEKIPEDAVKIWSDLDIKEVPQFGYRDVMYSVAWDKDWSVKQKVNGFFNRNLDDLGGSVKFAGGGAGLVHTFFRLVPEGLFATHPEYFSLVNGERIKGQWDSQICLTNPDVADVVTENALTWIAADPDIRYISISHNDNSNFCQCEHCTASYEQYGITGTLLNFVNEVAGNIKQEYPNMTVITLAYGPTRFLPLGGVVPADNVLMELCTSSERSSTIEQNSKKPTYSWDGSLQTPTGTGFIELMDGWKGITDRLFVWDYVANYFRLSAPWPNFHILRQNMNLFARYGARGIYSEGNGMTTGEFAEFKSYLLAKLSWNPMMTEEEYRYHYEDFLQGYYGEGWKNISDYIDTLTEIVTENEIGMGSSGEMHTYLPMKFNFATQSYDMTLIDDMNALWDNAEAYADDEQLQRIRKSRLQWTYYELHVTMDKRYEYGTTAQQNELRQRCQKLYQDFQKAGIVYGVGNEMFKQNVTDFTKSPRYWLGGIKSWPFD